MFVYDKGSHEIGREYRHNRSRSVQALRNVTLHEIQVNDLRSSQTHAAHILSRHTTIHC